MHACVVRLKGGDPMLFGRAQEEIDALADAGIELSKSSPASPRRWRRAADAQLSLTRRGVARSVAFVTPRVGEGEDPGAWAARPRRPTPPRSTWAPATPLRSTTALAAAGVR